MVLRVGASPAVVLADSSLSAAEKAALLLELARQTAAATGR